MPYRPTIGLEIHAELATATKMFCASKNDPDETRPNANVCPICLAHPGTLPVPNQKAIREVIRIGTAVGGTIADYAEFDRKSYFYPDIPKGYQISQYEHPLVSGGTLAGVRLTRIHLEEDTARSSHHGGESLVDFNRAGVPLMELVTEPVIHDAREAGRFARELQLLLRTLGASHANLEKGEMRIEANISVSDDEDALGTKVEVKNLNSFRSVERAIAFEVDRQCALLAAGKQVLQETRGWNETKGETFSQRLKEGSADYRYFPEPDIPKMIISEVPEFSEDAIRASLPELPWETRERFTASGIKPDDIEMLFREEYDFMRAVLEGIIELEKDSNIIRLAANYLVTDVAALWKGGIAAGKPTNLGTREFLALMRMLASRAVSSRGAKEILSIMYREGGAPEEIAKREGLLQVSDPDALKTIVESMLEKEPGALAEYRAGKEAILMYLVGKAMQASKGAGNPEAFKEIIKELASHA